MKVKKALYGLIVGIAGLVAAATANAFPEQNRPITIIVPYAAGGGVDFVARTVAAALERELDAQVQVENKPGASAQVGLTELVRSAPDGHTLALVVMPTVLSHYLDPSRGAIYTPESFQPVSHLYSVSYAMAVPVDSPYQDFASFIEDAKSNPGKIRLADAGLMTAPHVFTGLVEKATGARFAPVHFNGGAPAIAALLGKHVEGMSGGGSDFVPQLASGQLRILAVSTEEEDPLMPGVPSMKSLGYDVTFSTATGIAAPAGTPAEAVQVLEDALRRISETQEFQQALIGNGITPDFFGADEYRAFWAEYDRNVGPVIEDLLSQN